MDVSKPRTKKYPVLQHLTVSGHVQAGSASLRACGLVDFPVRMVTAELDIAETQYRYHIFSDFAARMMHIHAQEAQCSLRMILTGIDAPEILNATIWANDATVPECFCIHGPTIVKTRSLKESILEGRGDAIHKILGEQSYDTAEREFGPFLRASKEYEEFMHLTQLDSSQFPPAGRWWCIPIFVIPIIGIAGLLIPQCR